MREVFIIKLFDFENIKEGGSEDNKQIENLSMINASTF